MSKPSRTLSILQWVLLCAILTIGFFFSNTPASAQTAQASLDRTSIFAGETVILAIEVNGQVSGESPDVGRLTESFEILNTRDETSIQRINNQQTLFKRWIFELEPKIVGTLQLPSLSIGPNLSTNPLTLTVLPVPQQNDSARDIFIEVTVEPRNPYVQEQARYSERFFIAVPLTDHTLRREGVLQDALLQPLGEMKQYVAERDGRNYRVFERNYALIPEKSGELALPPLSLRGRIGNRQSGQLTLSRGRRVQVKSEPIVLQVRPRPADYGAGTDPAVLTWLPSWQLQLTEQWSDEPPVFRMGEPVTRTLIIEATGLEAGQLPEIGMQPLAGVNLYADQAETSTRYEDEWLIGRREQKIAIVPDRTGELTLPEIKLTWWDTQNDQQQTAVLPARTITILPVTSTQSPPNNNLASDAALSLADPPLNTPTANTPTPPPADVADDSGIFSLSESASWLANSTLWRWLSLVLLLLWLATLLAWRRARQQAQSPAATTEPSIVVSAKKLSQTVQQACQTHDARAAARALLEWANRVWPEHPPTSLGALALRCPHASTAIRALDQAIYDVNNKQTWQGDELAYTLRHGLTPNLNDAHSRQAPDDGLAPLYPQRS